jgi:hypothetical protein
MDDLKIPKIMVHVWTYNINYTIWMVSKKVINMKKHYTY